MLRGINKQQIFFDEQDCKKFIKTLIDCKKISGFKLYAYCLMPNHIHLLLKAENEDLSVIMKRIGCRFVYWYNAKYQRVGHLFQDRFKSEPVEDDEYFLCALRYIHLNPVEAGISNKCSDYKFSSYNWYFENGTLIDKDFTLSLININEFKRFHSLTEEKYAFLDIKDNKPTITEEQATNLINEMIESCKCDFQDLEKTEQKAIVKKLKSQGISIRQISKLLNVPKYMVEKA